MGEGDRVDGVGRWGSRREGGGRRRGRGGRWGRETEGEGAALLAAVSLQTGATPSALCGLQLPLQTGGLVPSRSTGARTAG